MVHMFRPCGYFSCPNILFPVSLLKSPFHLQSPLSWSLSVSLPSQARVTGGGLSPGSPLRFLGWTDCGVLAGGIAHILPLLCCH